jgi:hypothetical protein
MDGAVRFRSVTDPALSAAPARLPPPGQRGSPQSGDRDGESGSLGVRSGSGRTTGSTPLRTPSPGALSAGRQ